MQDNKKTYQGWINKETWVVNLWLNNDTGFNKILETAIDLESSVHKKAKWLEAVMQKETYDLPIELSIWLDLLVTAMGNVDWLEIIENN